MGDPGRETRRFGPRAALYRLLGALAAPPQHRPHVPSTRGVYYVFLRDRVVTPAQEQNNTCPRRVSERAPGLRSEAPVPATSPHQEPRAFWRRWKPQGGLGGRRMLGPPRDLGSAALPRASVSPSRPRAVAGWGPSGSSRHATALQAPHTPPSSARLPAPLTLEGGRSRDAHHRRASPAVHRPPRPTARVPRRRRRGNRRRTARQHQCHRGVSHCR